MKKTGIIAIVLIMTLILSNVGFVFAGTSEENAIGSVYVNNAKLNTTDATGKFWIDNAGRTQAPLRVLGEALNCAVTWDNASQTATLVSSDKATTIKVTIGKNYIMVNDTKKTMDCISYTITGRTYVPLRAISEALSMTVTANGAPMNIYITATVVANDNASLVIKPLTELVALNKAITDNGCSVESNAKFGDFTIEGTEDGGFNFTKDTRGYRIGGLYMDDDKHYAITKAFLNEVLPQTLANQFILDIDKYYKNSKTLTGTDWSNYYISVSAKKTYVEGGITIVVTRDRYNGATVEIYK